MLEENDELNKDKMFEEMEIIRAHVRDLSLKMKPVKVEYKGENKDKQLFIYFTAQNRVDFRELIKRLYTRHRCRIEMRQISVREHCQMLEAGVNTCSGSRVPCFVPWCMKSRFGGCFFDKQEEGEVSKYSYKEEG